MGAYLKGGIRANDLYEWLQTEGCRSGWMTLGKADNSTLRQGQEQANLGRVVIAIGQRQGAPGHVAAIVPEASAPDGIKGRTESNGTYHPVLSEAGGNNQKRTAKGTNWQATEFVQTAIWVHA
jgi:hypothetical protein